MTIKSLTSSLGSTLWSSAASATLVLAIGCGATSGSTGAAGTHGGAGATAGNGGTAGVPGTAGGAGPAGTSGADAAAGTTPGTAGTGPAGTSGADVGAGTTGTAGHDAGATDGGTDAPVATGPCTPPANADQPFDKLSQTGCMDSVAITKMASIVVPYEVNSPLWSDNADKTRGFVVPAGKKIHVKNCATASAECSQGPQDTGKWVMPVGTVMVKSFLFDGRLVETRLLAHPDAATWNGYSYKWNEAQTEATINPDDRVEVNFNTGSRIVDWHYPNRLDCTTCHTAQAGGTLGPETRQMNRTVGGMNQIDKWKALGLFETAPPTPYQAALVLPYAGQLGTVPAGATLEQRARSYLHANCAHCHRPDDQTVGWLDFRYDTTLKATGACGVTPMKGNVGVDGSLILSPTHPMMSAMWLRMDAPASTGKTRMPQLATYVIDDLGVKLIGDWITSVTACPQ